MNRRSIYIKTTNKILKNGSITLPKQIRDEAGLFPGNAVDIETSTDGTVTIKPSAPCCRFCGTVENVIIADNVIICRKCAEKLLAKVDKTND